MSLSRFVIGCIRVVVNVRTLLPTDVSRMSRGFPGPILDALTRLGSPRPTLTTSLPFRFPGSPAATVLGYPSCSVTPEGRHDLPLRHGRITALWSSLGGENTRPRHSGSEVGEVWSVDWTGNPETIGLSLTTDH